MRETSIGPPTCATTRRGRRALVASCSVGGAEQPGELLWQRYGAARVRINGDNGDYSVGDNGAVAPLDLLCQGEAAMATPLRRGDDPQPIALVAGLAVVKVDVHHHRDHPQLLEAV